MSRYAVCRRDKAGRWTFLARFGGRFAFTKHLSQARMFYDPRVAALEIVEDDEVVRDIDAHYTQQDAA